MADLILCAVSLILMSVCIWLGVDTRKHRIRSEKAAERAEAALARARAARASAGE